MQKARRIRLQAKGVLRPGQIALQGEDNRKHVVRLIGSIDGSGLIVTAPMQDGRPIFCAEGRAFRARYFDGRQLHQFPATVLKTATVPKPHLHLSLPSRDAVQHTMLRTDYRAEVFDLATIRYGAKANWAYQRPVCLMDISARGAQCLLEATFPWEEHSIRLIFTVPDRAGGGPPVQFDLRATVASRQPALLDGDEHELIGVSFEDVPERERLLLRALASESLLDEIGHHSLGRR